MKRIFLGIILVIFLLFVLFLIKEKFTQAQSSIGIELYVYPKGFYGGGGLIKIDNATERREEGIYKNTRYSSVIAGTEYQLKLINVGSGNFTLEFYKDDNTTPLRKLENINCSSILGKQNGSNCIIEGTFNQPSSDYEKWTIVLKHGQTTSTSFYLVKQSYAQNPGIASRDDQYYLEPTSTTAEPTSTINYTVYSNKLYCPNYMASGISTSTPNPSSGSFIHFSVTSSLFLTNDFVYRALGLSGISPGDYNLYLVNSLNQRIGPRSPVQVTIKVQPPFTPPPGAFTCSGGWCRCVFSYCYWYDGSNWVPTSSSVCGNVCTGGIRE
jgi:hypothetical protein